MKLKKSSKNEKLQAKINPKQMLQEKRNYTDSMQEDLELKGVDFFQPESETVEGSLHIDKDYLQLPLHITEVSAKELGEYLNAYTQQKMYMRTLIGWVECMLEEARREYYEKSEVKYRELSKTKLSETAKEREVNSDEEILPYFEAYMDCKKKLQLLNLNVASIEDAIFMISREVSRRTGDFETENRNHNVSRR